MKEEKNKPNELKRGDRGEQKSLKLKTERPELNKQRDAPIKRSIKFLNPQQCKETKGTQVSNTRNKRAGLSTNTAGIQEIMWA